MGKSVAYSARIFFFYILINHSISSASSNSSGGVIVSSLPFSLWNIYRLAWQVKWKYLKRSVVRSNAVVSKLNAVEYLWIPAKSLPAERFQHSYRNFRGMNNTWCMCDVGSCKHLQILNGTARIFVKNHDQEEKSDFTFSQKKISKALCTHLHICVRHFMLNYKVLRLYKVLRFF